MVVLVEIVRAKTVAVEVEEVEEVEEDRREVSVEYLRRKRQKQDSEKLEVWDVEDVEAEKGKYGISCFGLGVGRRQLRWLRLLEGRHTRARSSQNVVLVSRCWSKM